MPCDDILQSHPRRLARVMAIDGESPSDWRSEERPEILAHQLSAPLLIDLGAGQPEKERRLRELTAGVPDQTIASFRDLFHHPAPPIELLHMVKDFAKACRNDAQSPVPPEIATVLYYAGILVALRRTGRRITELRDDALRRGAAWVMAQPWVDPQTRELIREGLGHLRAGQ